MKRIILMLILLIFFNVTFCYYQCSDSRTNTIEGKELSEYLESYPQYLAQTQENAEQLKKMPFFNREDSFSRRNIEKTAKDFGKLSGVRPEYGENRGIVTFLNYRLTDILFLVFGVFLILRFHEERKKGMHLLVRTTERGRMPVVLARIGVYMAGIAVAAGFLYGSTYLLLSAIYPHAELSRAVQSVPELMQCVYPISIAQYLVGSVCVKYMAGLVFGLLLFAVLGIFHTGVSAVVFFLLLAGEYLMYLTIPPASGLAVLKYLNVFSVLYGQDAFLHYRNLNVFGYPVLLLSGQVVSGVVVCLILIIICCYYYGIAYAVRTNPFTRQWEAVTSWISRHRLCLPAFLWEWKKILISQKGLIILFAVFYLALGASQELRYLDLRNPCELHWYEDFAGELTEEKYAEMAAKQEKIQTKLERLEKAQQDMSQQLQQMTLMGADPYSLAMMSQKLSEIEESIAENEKELVGLKRVMENAESGIRYSRQSGRKIDLIEPYSYDLLLNRDDKTVRRNRLYILVACILAFSAVMSCEQVSHMQTTLHTLYRGRRRVLVCKLVPVALCGIVTAIAIHMIQFIQIGQSFPYHDYHLAAQSVECLRSFPLPVSIGGYLVMLYTARGLEAALAGICVMGIGRLSRDRVTCIILCFVFLLFPAILFSV